VQYSESAPFAVQETRDTLGMTMDNLLEPIIEEEQLVADRSIELGVYFVRVLCCWWLARPLTVRICRTPSTTESTAPRSTTSPSPFRLFRHCSPVRILVDAAQDHR
jgi:hypothetical protein